MRTVSFELLPIWIERELNVQGHPFAIGWDPLSGSRFASAAQPIIESSTPVTHSRWDLLWWLTEMKTLTWSICFTASAHEWLSRAAQLEPGLACIVSPSPYWATKWHPGCKFGKKLNFEKEAIWECKYAQHTRYACYTTHKICKYEKGHV